MTRPGFATFCRSARSAALAIVLSLVLAQHARAQSSPRPYRSLFGGASSGTDPNSNWFMLTTSEAYDQDVLGDVNAPIQRVFQKGGEFTELTGEINYRATVRRVQFASTAGTKFRYCSQPEQA